MTSPGSSVPPPAPEAPDRRPLGRVDLAILALVGALLVVWVPNLYLGLLTPRMAFTLVALGPGLVVVGRLVRRGDAGARWLAAFVTWALLAAVVAPHPRLALIGSYGTDTGWVWLAGFAAAWGLGRRLSPDGVRLLPRVLLVGLGANVLFGIIEAVVEPTGDLGTAEGRVLGLVSNSLFLAGLLCGGLALLGRSSAAPGRTRWVAVALVVPFVTASNLTGSRAALVGGAGLAVLGAAVAWHRRAHAPAQVAMGAAVVLVAVVAGFALSIPLQGATSSTSRIGEVSTSSGYESRTLAWGFGLEAVAERPIVGWGPGRFREATAPRTTAAFVRAEGPDKLFYDAHNLFVEHLVTSGVVGLVLLLGFVATAIGRARGPLAWFAAGVALTWMLNPASVCTAPVALVALGAAWRRAPAPAPAPAPLRVGPLPVGRSVGAALAAVGLLAGLNLLVVDGLVDRGTITGDIDTVELAQRLLPGDATLTGLVTDARFRGLSNGRGGPAAERAVLGSARQATREDPTRSTWWVRRAYAEGTFGPGSRADQLDRAEADLRAALERSPWSVEAMAGLYNLSGLRGDRAEVARWRRRLCTVDACPAAPAPDRDPALDGDAGG